MTFEFHFVQKSCVGRWKTTILPQILRFEFHFVRMGCILNLKIINLHQFLTCDAACLVAKSKISISRHICVSETHAPQRVYSRTTLAQDKFAFHHMFPNMHDIGPANTQFSQFKCHHMFVCPTCTFPAEGHVF